MKTKQILTFTLIIGIGIFLYVLVLNKFSNHKEPIEQSVQEKEEQRVACDAARLKICPDGTLVPRSGRLCEYEVCPEVKESKVLSHPVAFDSCGNASKYFTLPWWSDFEEQVGKVPYYSANQIRTITSYNNLTNLQEKITDSCSTMQPFCSTEKNRKLTIEHTSSEYREFEGCLSQDGTVFLASFSGEYGGGGNHVFRYLTEEKVLNEAVKLNEDAGGYSWSSGPSSFSKRRAGIIEMHGAWGDAGCRATQTYKYEYMKNEILWTKVCTACEGEKEACRVVKEGKVQLK